MNENTNELNGKGAILSMSILSIICLIVGILFIAVPYFTNGHNMQLALQTWSNAYDYYLALILLVAFPCYLKNLKKRGVSFELLKHEIVDKDKLGGDILFGLLAGIISIIIGYGFMYILSLLFPNKAAQNVSDNPPILVYLIVLGVIAPFVKEIVFRLYSKLFLEEKYGMLPAVLISSIIFAVFDWHNRGASFFCGLIWYLFYIKRRRLIVPMIGHSLINVLPYIIGLLIAH